MSAPVITSVSTWQPAPTPAPSPARLAVLQRLVQRAVALGNHRLRVAVDGLTASGKSSFGHELAAQIAAAGRPVLRASLDDFKRPWHERHLYDRTSGAGYYANAFDYATLRRVLLDPLAPGGSGVCALCSIDPLTQIDHSATTVQAPADAVLIADGVFAFRAEINDCWDLRIWLDVPIDVSIQRGTRRDGGQGPPAAADDVHRNRYLPAGQLYLADHHPIDIADVVIENSDPAAPRIIRS
jgi:uridine kinase